MGLRLPQVLTFLTILGVVGITFQTFLSPPHAGERKGARTQLKSRFQTDLTAEEAPIDAAEAIELDRVVHMQHGMLHPEHKGAAGGRDAVADVAMHVLHHEGRREELGFRGAFAHMLREDVSQCEYESLGWGAVRARVEAAVDVCVGATTISCTSPSPI